MLDESILEQEQLDKLLFLVDQYLNEHGNDTLQAIESLSGRKNSLPSDSEASSTRKKLASTRDLASSLNEFSDANGEIDFEFGANDHIRTSDFIPSRFQIIQPHAKGGLGEVFVASDVELNRKVALKEIQERFADEKESRRRFILEAEVTGGLEHPGIVPVYGLGRYEDGRPYYAMRFIQGDSLKEAIRDFHSLDSQSSRADRSLELRKLLGRFVDVCQAIGYAHSRGVLHRDLKPGNIMLGKYGETLVVDWGLAKVQSDGQDAPDKTNSKNSNSHSSTSDTFKFSAPAEIDSETMMGSAIGTPAYMPPEQARGDLDQLGPASDVYSLGATLFHLLTGRAPFRGKSVSDLLKEVIAGRFQPPILISPGIPKPLNAICLKAMSLDYEDRYPSPQDLAEEIERYLADEPVASYEEPLFSKLRRWIRNHQTIAATTASIVLISVIGLTVFSTIISGKNTQLNALNSSLESTNRELDARNEQLVVANEMETIAKQKAITSEQVARGQSELALSTLTSVVTDLHNGLAKFPGSAQVRRNLLLTALKKLKEVSTKYMEASTVSLKNAGALRKMAGVIVQFGTDPQTDQLTENKKDLVSVSTLAEELYVRAESDLKEILDNNPENYEATIESTSVSLDLGMLKLQTGEPTTALSCFEKAEAKLRARIRSHPSDNRVRCLLSESIKAQGTAYRNLGRYSDAIKTLERGVADFASASDLISDNELKEGYAAILTSLGMSKLGSKKIEDAESDFHEALEVSNSISGKNKFTLLRATILARLGEVGQRRGQTEEASWYFQQHFQVISHLASVDPSDFFRQRDLVRAHHMVAETSTGTDVEKHYTSAEAICRRLLAIDPEDGEVRRDLQVSLGNLGDICLKANNLRGAAAYFEEAKKSAEEMLEVDTGNVPARRDLSNVLERLGAICKMQGNFPDALKYFEQMRDQKQRIADQDRSSLLAVLELGIAIGQIADLHAEREDFSAALSNQTVSLKNIQEVYDADPDQLQPSIQLILALKSMGDIYGKQDDFDRCATYYKKSVEIVDSMIQKKMDVETAKEFRIALVSKYDQASRYAIAFGDWNRLMEQPESSIVAMLKMRAEQRLDKSNITESAQAAHELLQRVKENVDDSYRAAEILGLCLQSIASRKGSDDQRAEYTKLTLAALGQVVELGWSDFDRLAKNPAFKELSENDEFKRLMKEGVENSESKEGKSD